MIPINYLAVIAAAVVSMIIGFLWYGPIFGNAWIRLMGFTQGDIDAAKAKGMGKTYALMTLGSLIMAFVLAHSLFFAISYLKVGGLSGALQGAFWNWLGYVVPVLLSAVLFEGKKWKVWWLNIGYYLVSMIVMSLILVYWI